MLMCISLCLASTSGGRVNRFLNPCVHSLTERAERYNSGEVGAGVASNRIRSNGGTGHACRQRIGYYTSISSLPQIARYQVDPVRSCSINSVANVLGLRLDHFLTPFCSLLVFPFDLLQTSLAFFVRCVNDAFFQAQHIAFA